MEALAVRFEAEIMLLHAVTMREHNPAEELLPQDRRNWMRPGGRAQIFHHAAFVRDGRSIIGNCDVARRWATDLAMMPTHGHAAFSPASARSVTTKVLHHLDCPVSTGSHSEAAPLLEHIHCRGILCAVDPAERSRSILDLAAGLAGEYQERISTLICR